MSILIIGGSGLVGLYTARRFLREGYPVVVYDLYSGDVGDFFEGVAPPTYVKGDIRDVDHLTKVVDQYNIKGAVHAALSFRAAEILADLPGSFSAEVEGTFRLLEVVRRKNLRFVYVSTQAIYGPRDDLQPVKEDDRLNPIGIYPCWKAMCDLMCQNYHSVFQTDLVVTRLSWVYGPLRRKARPIVEQWLKKSLTGEKIELPDGADHQNDWTHADDAAEGIFLAYSVRPLRHRVFNISQGKSVSFKEIAQTIMKLVPGSSIKLGPGPSEAMIKASVPMRGPGDLSRARKELGFEPKYPIERGLTELLDWVKNREPFLKVE